eukprot:CAMPEP_0179224252 /NCGR_PEP_ID=MMETSP0797-20121207/7682_1 /TAXON_ID=47934 /ORGANISM="Dinophysis acuminata, Strain DAEP01" /LENGTH=85 /DNA_ID=CAMNT_0020931203 /DNA_START=44 /DNA_END=301 /DNA_ORIENTATION=+
MTLYHATNADAADSIDEEGFRMGTRGYQGAAVYLSMTREDAERRSQKGCSVVYEVTVALNDDNHTFNGYSYAIKDLSAIQDYRRI